MPKIPQIAGALLLLLCSCGESAVRSPYEDVLSGMEQDPGVIWIKMEPGEFIYGSDESLGSCRAPLFEHQVPVIFTRGALISAVGDIMVHGCIRPVREYSPPTGCTEPPA